MEDLFDKVWGRTTGKRNAIPKRYSVFDRWPSLSHSLSRPIHENIFDVSLLLLFSSYNHSIVSICTYLTNIQSFAFISVFKVDEAWWSRWTASIGWAWFLDAWHAFPFWNSSYWTTHFILSQMCSGNIFFSLLAGHLFFLFLFDKKNYVMNARWRLERGDGEAIPFK